MKWLRSKALRWTVGIVLALGLFGSVFVLFAARADHQQEGDARSTRPGGNAAIAQLLRDEGVAVRPRTRLAQIGSDVAGNETLVVTHSERLDREQARELLASGPGLLVLVDPAQETLDRFDLPARQHPVHAEQVTADCTVPAGQRAESILVDGGAYASDEATQTCFAAAAAGHVHLELSHADTGTRVLLVGTDFTNETLADDGNAAYAMNVLGSQPEVLWFVAPQASAPLGGDEGDPPGLLPKWWMPGVVQIVIAIAVIAVWRGRRLGPLMSENLPVVIPAAETVEGHGRLYDRHHASERAAEALRAGARHRLGRLLGHAEDPQALSQVLADRTGRDVTVVHGLLAGPPPTDDDQLHTLNQQLNTLEQEARQP